MDLGIKCIVNNPITSNCYIVFDSDSNECVIIDPGSQDANIICDFIDKHKLMPVYLFLTHEHFDHIWGVNHIKSIYPKIKLVCSDECFMNIQHRKQNFSVFYDGIGFEIKTVDVCFSDKTYEINWLQTKFELLKTPGHSEGSICIYLKEKNWLFTGDTIIYGLKTVTKLKGGNIDKLHTTCLYLDKIYKDKNPLLFPGHGVSVSYNEYKKQIPNEN